MSGWHRLDQTTHVSLPLLMDLWTKQEDSVEFHLHKSLSASPGGQYLWEISDQQNLQQPMVTVIYDGSSNIVQLHDTGQDEVTVVDLCRGSYYTVIKFSYGGKQYR